MTSMEILIVLKLEIVVAFKYSRRSAECIASSTIMPQGVKQGLLIRVGHSVLLRSVRYVLLRSKKRTLRSFPF